MGITFEPPSTLFVRNELIHRKTLDQVLAYSVVATMPITLSRSKLVVLQSTWISLFWLFLNVRNSEFCFPFYSLVKRVDNSVFPIAWYSLDVSRFWISWIWNMNTDLQNIIINNNSVSNQISHHCSQITTSSLALLIKTEIITYL